MAKIYYVGDWAIQLGPMYAETPFNYAWKGTDVFNYGHWLKEAIEADGRHSVTSVPTWEFYRMPPGQYERILDEHDVLIFSDVEAKCFQLDPGFFQRERFGKEVLSFPDRVRLTVEAVHAGKGMVFCGGWLSFNGEMGKGGWGRTRLAEVLPVTCLEVEDLRESTEGFGLEAVAAGHPIVTGTDLATAPPVLGYNRTRPRPEATVLATWKGTPDPALTAAEFGRGRVVAYTSDPAPHWGCNFVFWEGYRRLWPQVCDWLTEPRAEPVTT